MLKKNFKCMHKSTDEMKYSRGFQLQLEAGTGLTSVQSRASKPFHSWPPQRNMCVTLGIWVCKTSTNKYVLGKIINNSILKQFFGYI